MWRRGGLSVVTLAPFTEEEQWPGLEFFLKEKLREGRVALCAPALLEEGEPKNDPPDHWAVSSRCGRLRDSLRAGREKKKAPALSPGMAHSAAGRNPSKTERSQNSPGEEGGEENHTLSHGMSVSPTPPSDHG